MNMIAKVVVLVASAAPACAFSILPASVRTVETWNKDVTVARSLASPTAGRSATLASHSAPTGHWDATFFSPSKINLFLRVMGKRPDGFHDLASLFQVQMINVDDTGRVQHSRRSTSEYTGPWQHASTLGRLWGPLWQSVLLGTAMRLSPLAVL